MLSSLAMVLAMAVVGVFSAPAASAAASVPVTGLFFSGPDHTPLRVGDSVLLEGNWGSIDNPAGGETFTVNLPSVFQLNYPDGALTGVTLDGYGSCVVSGSSKLLTCTLNSEHPDESNVHGSFKLSMKATGTTTDEQVQFTVNGVTSSVDLPGDGGIGDGSSLQTQLDKTGTLNSNKWSMDWTITLGGARIAGMSSVAITDTLGGHGHALCAGPTVTATRGGGSAITPNIANTGSPTAPVFTLAMPTGKTFDSNTKYVIKYTTCTTGNTIVLSESYTNTASFTGINGPETIGPATVNQDYVGELGKSGDFTDNPTSRYHKIRWTVTIPGQSIKGTSQVDIGEVLTGDQALCDPNGAADYGLNVSVAEWYGPNPSNDLRTTITGSANLAYSKTNGKNFTITLNSGGSGYTFKDYPYQYKVSYTTCVTDSGLSDQGEGFTNQTTVGVQTVTKTVTMPTWKKDKVGTLNTDPKTLGGQTYAPYTTLDWAITVPGQDIAGASPVTLTDTATNQLICTPGGTSGTTSDDLKARLGLGVTAKNQVSGGNLVQDSLLAATTVSIDGSGHLVFTVTPTGGTHFSREYQYVLTYTLCTASGGMDADGTTYTNSVTGVANISDSTVVLSYDAWGSGSGVTGGSFSLTKNVTGTAADRTAGKTFTVHVEEYPASVPGSAISYNMDVTAGTPVSGLYARGSTWRIKLTEPSFPGGVTGVWFDPVFTAGTGAADNVEIQDGGKTAIITPTPGANVAVTLTNKVDKTYAVGDYVWLDENENGVQDDDELPVENVKVEIADADGNPVTDVFGNTVAATLTDSRGLYLFDNLPAGCYQLRFTLTDQSVVDGIGDVSSYMFTDRDRGEDDALDSDADGAGRTASFCLGTGDDSQPLVTGDYPGLVFGATEGIDPTWDAGIHVRHPAPPAPAKTYAVGDYTWIDSNKNGVQDAGEPVLAGVKVELLDAKGAVINSTTTDAQGRYLFDELESGTYQVRFTLTPDQATKYSFTKADQGNDAKDSDANQATGLTKTFVLDDTNTALTKSYDRTIKATEGIDPTWDAGVIVGSVSVGDYVWYDANGNGRQDKGEPGIEGVTMCLVGPDGKSVTDVFGNPVKPVKTDRDGKYTFENLPVLGAGQSYTVCIDQAASKHALENYAPTKDGVGDRAGDSSTWTAKSQGLTKDGERDSTLDFGFVRLEVEDAAVKTYAIGDYVWIDTVYNAVQDGSEKGLAGVTVELLNAKGKVLASTTTDTKGYYLFDGLKAGKYQVRFTLTDQQALKYGFVMANRGTDDAIDSDGVVGRNTAVAVTAVFRLDDSNAALTKDYRRPIAASEGIDPTWDAGVASLDVLGVEELEALPDSTEVVPGDKDDIAYTGVPTWSLLTLALLLLAGGGALVMGARRRGSRQE